LGSEAACGLKYDKAAIAAFISYKVDAADMSFAGELDTHSWVTNLSIEKMSESSLVAHCTQTPRVAKRYGFIK
jgi:hypothetical protein